ncbi:hypothetical protein [Bifidobacterium aemilianum]|uniref:hypothetical protein n=1 Tax=Bifidobacterium aemilianum TaxID=2493120 RepID=UPI001F1FAD4E|nr:hypothetical protein [Bifidobacterium aemilianum]
MLNYLAQTIVNIRAVLSSDIIIGGDVAQYPTDSDLATLRDLVKASFTIDSPRSAIRKSICRPYQDIVGAALR